MGLATPSIPRKRLTNLKGKAFADARNVAPPQPGCKSTDIGKRNKYKNTGKPPALASSGKVLKFPVQPTHVQTAMQQCGMRKEITKETRINSQDFHSVTNKCHCQIFLDGKGLVSCKCNCQCRIAPVAEQTSSKQYNAPTIAEVAALITNDFGDGEPIRDIVVCQKDSPPKRISELHPFYMALQYPLLFLYGEDGYHEQIPYHTNKGKRKTAKDCVTMKEYYAYVIQYKKDQWTTLHRGGRLFQQYLVDAFTAIEEQRLSWTRNNQDTLRVDLYHNVVDEITRGDTDATCLGKRIMLPISFTGDPRYMMQNYQDAMALCRTYGNPNLFITFTSNLKWAEITKMLVYIPSQRAHDRPEVGAMVFKLKLPELLDDLTKNHVFGSTSADEVNSELAMFTEACQAAYEASKPKVHRTSVQRDRYGAHDRLVMEYFSEHPQYDEATFRECFRMSQRLFTKIVREVTDASHFFQQIDDCAGHRGISALMKCTSAIRQLEYGCVPDSLDEYL
nr:hypothetical protein CTI12_AA123990 [Tanacetum cinerariifolium]